MKRTIIIGDIHGCIAELEELWGIVEPTKEDNIVPVGDLVDRGPDSPGVVRFLHSKLQEGYKVLPIMGNHEFKHRRGNKRPRTAALVQALTDTELQWIKMFPYYYRDGDILVVHGGLTEDITFLPDMADIRKYNDKKRQKYDNMMFVRYLDEDFEFAKRFRPRPGDVFWAEVYDGRLGHAYFGHQPYMREDPRIFDHATGLDLACVFGGVLCAAVITDGVREFVTVPARETYSNSYIPVE